MFHGKMMNKSIASCSTDPYASSSSSSCLTSILCFPSYEQQSANCWQQLHESNNYPFFTAANSSSTSTFFAHCPVVATPAAQLNFPTAAAGINYPAAAAIDHNGFRDEVKTEEGTELNLGHRAYFSTNVSDHVVSLQAAAALQGRSMVYGSGQQQQRQYYYHQQQPPRCQAEGCKADLTGAKHYHRRHKVCEFHSKATVVVTSGLHQRFCQQCSRFHVLSEFDESKRSCRKRLADHNRRRRKFQPSSTTDDHNCSSKNTNITAFKNNNNQKIVKDTTKSKISSIRTAAADSVLVTVASNSNILSHGGGADGCRNHIVINNQQQQQQQQQQQGLSHGYSSSTNNNNGYFDHHNFF